MFSLGVEIIWKQTENPVWVRGRETKLGNQVASE